MNGMPCARHGPAKVPLAFILGVSDRAGEGNWAPQGSLKGSVQVLEKIKMSWES